ncbi:MAG: hypothetical protein DWQ02_03510 [Bacteroidetes bacterium]|nr:MAG: hypothetical protein DWQ02_03510 [Bacteroidota bacterium]
MKKGQLLLLSTLTALLFLSATHGYSQGEERPFMAAAIIENPVILDGLLNDSEWNRAELNDQFKTTVPVEGGVPSGKTQIQVLAHPKYLIIGIRCFDDTPEGIVSFSKLRDTDLENEDHIRIVIDPFMDGQSGIIFAVNANGARYDALVSNRGESENEDWDAIWEAKAVIDSLGWSVEIKIPIQSISFKKGLTTWGFNVERRIQRNQETIRWANIRRDQWFIQTSRAGLLTNLPEFDYGVGLNIRPSLITDFSRADGEDFVASIDPSLDISQRLGPNAQASLTVNTDFAETEVDTRQTNLTRFPLFFPEKRAFFLEGADIFEFGFGLRRTAIPFFSRRIGLYEGDAVPISVGGKVNGRIGKTAFGGLAMGTRSFESEDVSLPASKLGVIRVKQNIFKESSIGFISTFGDPESRGSSWTSGIDFTYQTTRFRGDKNFLVGVSGMYANRADLTGDQSAFAFKVDYPNDIWDMAFTYLRIGDSFDPSLGFVPRKSNNTFRVGLTYAPRPSWRWLRQMRNQLYITFVTDLKGQWESYRIFTAPVNWRLESGDRVEINYMPRGERLPESFEISDGIVIPEGKYHFHRYRLETALAAKRKLNGQLTWWLGSFYGGQLDELEASINWNPSSIITFEFVGTHNIGQLPGGDFTQTLIGFRIRYNVSPDLQLNSFIQFDTETKEFGVNARIHWIYHPQGDLFFVFNHNTLDGLERWELINQQVLLKARYNFRL